MEESYKKFNIANIIGHSVEDYVSSDSMEFARIKDITIIPKIKEIRHGEYIIYVSAYSKEEAEYEHNQKIVLEIN